MAIGDPSSLCVDGDDVVIQLREVELRMTTPQFVTFAEAVSEFLFRDFRGELDINDPNRCPEREHHELRELYRKILSGVVGGEFVPDALRWSIMSELVRRRIDPELWIDLKEQLRRAHEEIESKGSKGSKPRRTRTKSGGNP
jgi:hypothetical protein